MLIFVHFSQFQEKEAIFKDQLLQLNSLLPTLQLHLVSSTAFSNSANKLEFLSLGYVSNTTAPPGT